MLTQIYIDDDHGTIAYELVLLAEIEHIVPRNNNHPNTMYYYKFAVPIVEVRMQSPTGSTTNCCISNTLASAINSPTTPAAPATPVATCFASPTSVVTTPMATTGTPTTVASSVTTPTSVEVSCTATGAGTAGTAEGADDAEGGEGAEGAEGAEGVESDRTYTYDLCNLDRICKFVVFSRSCLQTQTQTQAQTQT